MSNVIEIGDFSIARAQRTHGYGKGCQHRKVTLVSDGEIVRCNDCTYQPSAWWLVHELLSHYTQSRARVNSERRQLAEDQERFATDKAALRLSSMWRKRFMVPACPHCRRAIGPKDGFGDTLIRKETTL